MAGTGITDFERGLGDIDPALIEQAFGMGETKFLDVVENSGAVNLTKTLIEAGVLKPHGSGKLLERRGGGVN